MDENQKELNQYMAARMEVVKSALDAQGLAHVTVVDDPSDDATIGGYAIA